MSAGSYSIGLRGCVFCVLGSAKWARFIGGRFGVGFLFALVPVGKIDNYADKYGEHVRMFVSISCCFHSSWHIGN